MFLLAPPCRMKTRTGTFPTVANAKSVSLKSQMKVDSLVDCQCWVLHHPVVLRPAGGVGGPLLCFVHPQVFIHLCWSRVSSEVHCRVDCAAHFLGGDNLCHVTFLWRRSEAQTAFNLLLRSDNESQRHRVSCPALTVASCFSDSRGASPYLSRRKK